MRRVVGAALLLAGAGMLSYAGAIYVRGIIARDAARADWNEQLARRTRLALNATLDRSSGAALVTPGAPVARLAIPRLRLNEVVIEGVDDEQLNAGPGHLPGSVLPGDAGNAVISAHRDRHFRRLDEVAVGDTVITETARVRTAWIVTARRVVDAGAPALFASAEATLTLTTCWPVRLMGPAPDRLIITARAVAREARA